MSRWSRVVGVVGVMLLAAVVAGGGAAQSAGAEAASTKVALASFEGGSIEGLVAGAGTEVTSVWVSVGGSLVGYTAGAPGFVNSGFEAVFPGGVLAAGTVVLIVYPAGAATPPGTITSVEPAGSTPGSELCSNAIGNGLELVAGPDGPLGADADSVFRSLTVDPTDAQTVILGTERNGAVVSHDGGVTWTRSREGIRHAPEGYPEFWDIAISPHDPSLVIAATLSSPGPVAGDWPSSSAGVYRSTDGGATWTRSNCGLTNSRITSVSFDAVDASVVVIGIEGGTPSFTPAPPEGTSLGGLFRSTDAGLTWVQVSEGTSADTNGFWRMESRASGGSVGTVLTFGLAYTDLEENLGFLRSDDGGASWTALAEEHRTRQVTSFDTSLDGQTIYAHERSSFENWRSDDGGVTWSSYSHPNANGPIAVSPADRNVVLFAGRTTLWRSTNGLTSVVQVLETGMTSNGTQGVIHDIEFAASNPSVVYVATEGYLVYRSDDGGVTWSLVADVRGDVLGVGE